MMYLVKMSDQPVTQYLEQWRHGDPVALQRLTTAMYSELRRIAAAVLRKGGGPPTINPTALVHELYLRLPGLKSLDMPSRVDFLNLSARVMRNILVDLARKRKASKRAGHRACLALEAEFGANDPGLEISVLLINDVLDEFAATYPRQARVVELRFFGGLTEDEAREVLQAEGYDSSPRTIARDWVFAKAWLYKRASPSKQ